jgi:ABC-type polysaccharide/polyol phosphate transport system ATPase subunit
MNLTPTLLFEGVSKTYQQRHQDEASGTLWALRDVSFACHEGEVVGLIGRNGCGKSTTLKLAANVTAPSSGTVTATHPIAPMLELGAGFHPDLSGRDNIRLNGSLLGLGRRISKSQFDEIVAFAEIEQHVDTPLKHYSSGMSARLGFAIAVHSPARLLLVDEVLSVGDKLFQQKCQVRMNELKKQGTTILLVSHDDSWIRNFCTRALLFEAGSVVADTVPDEALRQYDLRLYKSLGGGKDGLSIESVEVTGMEGEMFQWLLKDSIEFKIRYDARGVKVDWLFVARVRREDGVYCASFIARTPEGVTSGTALLNIGRLPLVGGRYVMEVSIEDASSHGALATQVSEPFGIPGDFDQKRGYEGIVRVEEQWHFG